MKPLMILFCIVFSFTHFVYGELTSHEPESENTVATCVPGTNRNKEIINHCKANWESWGIDPPPSQDLRSVNECSSGALAKGANFLQGCGASVTAPIVFLGTLSLLAASKLGNSEDRTSDEYILKNGSKDEIEGVLREQWMIERCGLGSVRPNEFMDQECGSRPEDHTIGRRDCGPALEKLREQRACRRSPEITKQFQGDGSRPGAIEVIRSKAAQRYYDNTANQQLKQRLKDIENTIVRDCEHHINPYRRSFLSRFSEKSISLEIFHALSPNPEHVNQFNQCVENHPQKTETKMRDLTETGRGLIDDLVASVEAFPCYNKNIRNELYCDLAIAGLTLGTGAAVQAVSRLSDRLGREKISKLTAGYFTIKAKKNPEGASSLEQNASSMAIEETIEKTAYTSLAPLATPNQSLSGMLRNDVEKAMMSVRRSEFKLDPRFTICMAYRSQHLRRLRLENSQTERPELSLKRHATSFYTNLKRFPQIENLFSKVNQNPGDAQLYQAIAKSYSGNQQKAADQIMNCYQAMTKISNTKGEVLKPQRLQRTLQLAID